MQLKKSINFGDVSQNFQTVASKLKELEGTFTDGFENNIKYLLDNKHWNKNNLVDGKPPISLRTRMDHHDFEVHCFPIIKNEAQAVIVPFDKFSPFTEYNPASFGPLCKITGLNNLISTAVLKGDEADNELIKYAHMMTEQLITLFNQRFVVTERTGFSVQEFFINAIEDAKLEKVI